MSDSACVQLSESERLLDHWQHKGYVILRGCFTGPQVREVNSLVDGLWQQRTDLIAPITIDTDLETDRQKRVLFREVPAATRQNTYKINDLYLEYEEIRSMVLDPALSRVVGMLLGGAPMVVNTLNFEYGSQQTDHVDSFYMPSRKPGGMLASWIALDPVTEGNGPVRIYPGSHLIPAYRFSDGGGKAIAAEMPACQRYLEEQISERGLAPELFTAGPGDVLIWHSQLLHGGTAIRDRGTTRRSLVTHYFRKKDYRHHLWRVRKHAAGGYYYSRCHQPTQS